MADRYRKLSGVKYRLLSMIEERSTDSSTTTSEPDLEYVEEKCSNYPRDTELASTNTPRAANSTWLWLIHALLLSLSITLFSFSIVRRPSTLEHVRNFSAWSPADTAVEYQTVRYNVSTKSNRFVGAGPEVDQAWREISYDVGDQWISRTDLERLGMPETSLMVDHPKTGEQGYRVGIEVFHQLHCLNLLRRVAYREYYEPLGGEFAAGPEALRHHADHCIEVLRLNLQCNADIGLFTLYMIPGDPQAWPELNSRHVCRNFNRVRQWALDNSVGNMELLESE